MGAICAPSGAGKNLSEGREETANDGMRYEGGWRGQREGD